MHPAGARGRPGPQAACCAALRVLRSKHACGRSPGMQAAGRPGRGCLSACWLLVWPGCMWLGDVLYCLLSAF